jgi:hypothetical protein
MNISHEGIVRVQALGYTPEEARFLYMVATFSGYFVPRQFTTFVGAKQGKRSDRFTGKLEGRGHATWREYLEVGGVYHLFSRTLYRAIDKENLRNRRRHSTDFIRTRLVLLDFVLRNQGHNYLETEDDRVSYFCQRLGIPKAALPVKAYSGLSRAASSLRYFVDKFPLFVDGTGDTSDPPVTLSYVDAGERSIARFVRHLNAYKQLLANLANFDFLYLSNSTMNFPAAERAFGAFASRALRDDPSAELLRYFTLRDRWDKKQYGGFSNDEIEWLNEANSRFRSQETERLYAAWCSGELADDALATHLAGTRPPRRFRFSPSLVSIGHRTATELARTE